MVLFLFLPYLTNRNIFETLIKNIFVDAYMNLKEIREKIVCNQKEKANLFESGFIEETNSVFRTHIEKGLNGVKEIVMRLEVISLLVTSKEKKIKKEIDKNIDLYFNIFMKILHRELEPDSIKVAHDFQTFFESITQSDDINKQESSESYEEEVYKEFEWINPDQIRPRVRRRIVRNQEIAPQQSDARFTTITAPVAPPMSDTSADEFLSNFISIRNDETSSVDNESTSNNTLANQIMEERMNNTFDRSSESAEPTTDIEDYNITVSSRILRYIRRRDGDGAGFQGFRRAESRYSDLNMPYEFDNQISTNNLENPQIRNTLDGNISGRINELMNLINSRFQSGNTVSELAEPDLSRLERFFEDIMQTRLNARERENSPVRNQTLLLEIQQLEESSPNEPTNDIPYHILADALETSRIINSTQLISTNQPEIEETMVLESRVLSQRRYDDVSVLGSMEEINNSLLHDRIREPEKAGIRPSTVNNEICNFIIEKHNQVIVNLFRYFCKILYNCHKISDEIQFYIVWIYITDSMRALEEKCRTQIMEILTNFFCTLFIRKSFIILLRRDIIINHFVLTNDNARLFAELIGDKNLNNIPIESFICLNDNSSGMCESYLRCYANWIIGNNDPDLHHENAFLLMIMDLLSEEKEFALLFLGKVCQKRREIQELCLKIGLVDKIIEVFRRKICTNGNLTLVLYSLSSLIEDSEDNRKLICTKNILAPLFEILKLKVKGKEFDRTTLLIIHFIRNTTRCLKFVRSELMEFPIIELFLLLLTYAKKSRGGKDIGICEIIEGKMEKNDRICSFLLLKVALSIIGNLMMEFGNYKSKFIGKNGPVIIARFVRRRNLEFFPIFVFKNFFYDANWKTKEKIMSIFPNRLIKKFSSEKIGVQSTLNRSYCADIQSGQINIEQIIVNVTIHLSSNLNSIQSDTTNMFYRIISKHNPTKTGKRNSRSKNSLNILRELFNMIRNMTCSSHNEVRSFLLYYPLILDHIIFMFIRLINQELFKKKREVICEILYIMSNLCSCNSNLRDLFSCDLILNNAKRLFEVKDRKVIVALIWFTTNISWHDDENLLRIKKLIEFGFKDWLCKIRLIDSFLNDKVVTVLDNLDV